MRPDGLLEGGVREEMRLLFVSSRAESAEPREPGSGAGRDRAAITIANNKG
jgi:hypothetical protein